MNHVSAGLSWSQQVGIQCAQKRFIAKLITVGALYIRPPGASKGEDDCIIKSWA